MVYAKCLLWSKNIFNQMFISISNFSVFSVQIGVFAHKLPKFQHSLFVLNFCLSNFLLYLVINSKSIFLKSIDFNIPQNGRNGITDNFEVRNNALRRLDIFCQFFDNFFFWFIRNFGLNTQLPHFSLWFLEV